LTQVLKYESYHDSHLAEFLIERALRNRNRIGYFFFWFLKAEMHVAEIAERYGLLLEVYLRGCGKIHRQELMKQNFVVNSLTNVAVKIKGHKDPERLNVLQTELSQIPFPKKKFTLPLDPRIQVRGLNIPKCKYMDSKKLPLWLNFQNAEANAENVYIIFKAGDDLRQDVLTLQMIRLMDKLWKEEGGLDLLLLPYKCISTGQDIGMIEVVLNSETTAAINKERSGAISVLQKDTLLKWLEKNNPSQSEKQKAIDTFVLSCAGYCVATYVLGVGDRHNDNIMMTRTGNLFHIDFGHFLGNYKKKNLESKEKEHPLFLLLNMPPSWVEAMLNHSKNLKKFVFALTTLLEAKLNYLFVFLK